MADRNPLFDDKETLHKVSNGGIGFNSPIEAINETIIVEHDYEPRPNKALRVFAKLFTVFGIIFSSLSMMYFLLPIFSAVIGGLIALILIMFMIFSVVITLGIVLMFDGYRDWIGNHMLDIPNFFFNLSDNIVKLAPYYPVVGIPGIVLTGIGLILGIVGTAKGYKSFIPHIVLNAIFISIAIFFTFLYYSSGMRIFGE